MRSRLGTALGLVVALGLVAPAMAAGSPVIARAAASSVERPVSVEMIDLVVPRATGPALAATLPDDAAAPDDAVLADAVAAGGRVETPVIEADLFQTVGITWPAGAVADGLDPQVRVRADGAWSPWLELEADAHQPTAGSPDAAGARGGTDPLWVGDADAVQVSLDAAGAAPQGMQLVLVDAGVLPTDATAPALQAASGAPSIVSREAWGARPAACAMDIAPRLKGAVVHHTAGADYTTQAQAMQQIRGDQAFHIDTNRWCDIGYNFLVDKWGTIYEGRDNSLTRPVIGAHATGANTGTVGVAMLGTFTTSTPSAAAQQSTGRVIGWRLGAYGLDPLSSTTYAITVTGTKFAVGTTQTLPRIIGHRDMVATECPGEDGKETLDAIRATAASVAATPDIPADVAFGDVDATNPFYADIVWLKDSDVTTGYPDGTYRPKGSVTREAMAAFLYRVEHGTDAAPPTCDGAVRTFTDVPATNRFCGAIEALADEGVLGGWPDRTFRPSQPVSRQAIAAFLYRFASGSAEMPECTGADRAFVDVPSSNAFCGAIEWLAGTGVTTGWPDRTFRPTLSITREAMAAFLHRLDGYLA